jgi:hypothetical protein
MKRAFFGALGLTTLMLLTPAPAGAGWKNFGLGNPPPGSFGSDEPQFDYGLDNTLDSLLDSGMDELLPQASEFVDVPANDYVDNGMQTAQVPAPGTLGLVLLALGGLAWARVRPSRAATSFRVSFAK